jgi:hypothetical protein
MDFKLEIAGAGGDAWRYRFLDHEIVSPAEVPILASLQIAGPRRTPVTSEPQERRPLQVRTIDGAWRLERGQATLTLRGRETLELSTGPILADEEMVLAALTLASASSGWMMLHASAVLGRDGLVLFLGESGAGKSTLARLLAGQEPWQHFADDIVPLDLSQKPEIRGSAVYPQPKWPGHDWRRLEKALVGAVVWLGAPREQVELQNLRPAQAATYLLQSLVAARLFSSAEIEERLATIAKIAETLPFFALHYPRRFAAVDRVAEVLGQCAEAFR